MLKVLTITDVAAVLIDWRATSLSRLGWIT